MGVRSEDMTGRVRKAVERSTLDQPGTKPFHLRAVLAPSFDRDKDSHRTGEVELWWASPTRWRREVRSPEFQQIEVVDGGRDWQKNEGDYFPEWLRVIAVALVRPVPDLKQVLEWVKTAEVRSLMGQTNIIWDTTSAEGHVQEVLRGGVGLMDGTGLLFHGGGPGWAFRGNDYQDFHGRMVARTVSVGAPEVTARVVVLEDLGRIPARMLDAKVQGGDEQWLSTVVVGEADLRKNLLPMEPVNWRSLPDGPLEGRAAANIVLDREGKVRELETVVADNQGVIEEATKAFAAMRFQPYLVDGVPVQVVATMSMPFKTTRSAKAENFESARNYFEHGREVGFPSARSGMSYFLRAEFSARGSSNEVEKGTYEDTWMSDGQWRREAWFGKSRYVRTRNGEKRYEMAEGPEAGLLWLVFRVMEPIPAIDTFSESDWSIKRDLVDGAPTVRVASGDEGVDGKPDPVHFRGYWFADTGQVVKTYVRGLETRLMAFNDFDGGRVTRRVDVLTEGKPVMKVQVTELKPAGIVDTTMFLLPGHEWVRAITDEVR